MRAIWGVSVSTSDHTTDRDGQSGDGMAEFRRDSFTGSSDGQDGAIEGFRPFSGANGSYSASIDPISPSFPFLGLLAETVENVVIPRLSVNFGVDIEAVRQALVAAKPLERDVISAFCRLIVGPDSRDAFRFVEILLERGVPTETILLDLMAPAARVMGEMWEADLCNFVDVTVGLARIQQMTRQIRPGIFGKVGGFGQKGAILLVPVPGEQHTFGLRIVEEFFLRDGWDVDCVMRAGAEEIAAAVADKSYDIIGLTLGGHRLLEPLRSAITLARYHSLNRSIKVVIGGVGLTDYPDLMSRVEADACLTDVNDAVTLANSWVRKTASS